MAVGQIQESYCEEYVERNRALFRLFATQSGHSAEITNVLKLSTDCVAAFHREADDEEANRMRMTGNERSFPSCQPSPEATRFAMMEALQYMVEGEFLDIHDVAMVRRRAQEMHLRCRRREELSSLLRNGFGAQQWEGLLEVFACLDSDNSGFLEFPEMVTAVEMAGLVISRERCAEIFRELDKDHSKCFDFEEFLHFLQRLQKTAMFDEPSVFCASLTA